ncbi:MAG TPA: ion channel [Candidatus Dormibacteraeota bacterium]|nr:ion channel [Candidatus Dormibacteraeota bacterium]
MTAEQVLWCVIGLIVIAIVFYDLFQTVVLPRPSVGRVQLARKLVRPMWLMWRWVSQRTTRLERSEARLAAFAPIALLTLFFVWAAALVAGYGLLLTGLREQIRPAPQDLITTMYISASTLVPLAYGDFVPEGGLARAVIIAESATGVGLAAIAITLLFSLYESFRAREELVVSLDALAGAPPSGVQILENASLHGMRPELKDTFDDWRKWSAMVLESHLAYPLLIYFRSSHDNEAWINSFGAVMDAAILIISTVKDDSEGPARLMYKIGSHLVEDMNWVFRFKGSDDAIVERAEYQVAVERLVKAGYNIRDVEAGWKQFAELRSIYATPLNQMANWLVIPPAEWIGDRSYLPHRKRSSRIRLRRPAATGEAKPTS